MNNMSGYFLKVLVTCYSKKMSKGVVNSQLFAWYPELVELFFCVNSAQKMLESLKIVPLYTDDYFCFSCAFTELKKLIFSVFLMFFTFRLKILQLFILWILQKYLTSTKCMSYTIHVLSCFSSGTSFSLKLVI